MRTIKVFTAETNISDDASTILRKIKSKSFFFSLSGHIANLCEKVDILPYERYDSVMQGIGHFTEMVSAVSHYKCLDTIMEMRAKGRLEVSSNLKCLWPK